jgi:hypothetical protein
VLQAAAVRGKAQRAVAEERVVAVIRPALEFAVQAVESAAGRAARLPRPASDLVRGEAHPPRCTAVPEGVALDAFALPITPRDGGTGL